MNDQIPRVYPMKVRVVKVNPWEKELREWYSANPPPGPLVYHYCDNMTACTAPLSSELFEEIYAKLTSPGSKVKAVKLTMTFGDTVCRPGEQYSKKLGRMEAWRRAKHIDLWVREAHVKDGLITLTAFEEMDNYGGHIRIEFTRWLNSTKQQGPRTRLVSLSAHFSRCKSYNEKWRR